MRALFFTQKIAHYAAGKMSKMRKQQMHFSPVLVNAGSIMKDKYTAAYRRFKEIDSMIREGSVSKHFKKVSDMAAVLGVSKRTVERDILYMSSSDIALPIQYDAKNHTYYYLPEDLKKKSFADILLNNSDKQFISLARSLLLSFFSGTDSYYEAYKT